MYLVVPDARMCEPDMTQSLLSVSPLGSVDPEASAQWYGGLPPPIMNAMLWDADLPEIHVGRLDGVALSTPVVDIVVVTGFVELT